MKASECKKIYFDMDGVIVDFMGGVEEFCGMVELVKAMYEKYGDNCQILTGIPKPKRGVLHSEEDKRRWIAEYISPDITVNVCFKEEKKLC